MIAKFSLFNRSEICYPTSDSNLISIPVYIPNWCIVYTTFSEHTLPVGVLEYGQPPNPATDESMIDNPCYIII